MDAIAERPAVGGGGGAGAARPISLSRKIRFLIRQGEFGMMTRRLLHRLYSSTKSYGLRRDLAVPFEPPPAAIPLTIRPIEERDVEFLFSTEGLSTHDAEECMARKLLLDSGLPACYVGADADGNACFSGWLFRSDDNERIRAYFRNGFPQLKPEEAIFEFAYTRPSHRRLQIMPFAMSEISREAMKFGARYVLAFCDYRNASSLRRCRRAGFFPYLLKTESCRLFRRTVRFEALSPDLYASVLAIAEEEQA